MATVLRGRASSGSRLGHGARNKVVMGTLLLSASSLFVQVIGFAFRAYLSNIIGAEGMGVFSLVMSVYSLCVIVATSSLSIAVSKLVAEQLSLGSRANARRVLGRALTMALLISGAVAVALFVGAGPISERVLGDERTRLPLLLLAPSLPFLSLSGCLRGYFIAGRAMGTPASSQVLVQLFRVAFIMALITRLAPMDTQAVCAVVVLGATLGEALCFLYCLAGYLWQERRRGTRQRADVTGVTRSILAMIIPISLGNYIRSALLLLEDLLILSGLRRFSGTDDVATGAYGMMRGMVMPLLVFPMGLLSAFLVTLTPEVSRLHAGGDRARLGEAVTQILRYTAMAGMLVAAVFTTFSHELGMVVYNDAQVGTLVRRLAWLCPFLCVEMVTVAILQGLGEQVSSLRYGVCDSLLRIALACLLIPRSGLNGFLTMMMVSSLFTALLNLRRLVLATGISVKPVDWALAPALGAAFAGQGARLACNALLTDAPAMWQLVVGGSLLTALLYLAALALLGCIRRSDLSWMTKGRGR